MHKNEFDAALLPGFRSATAQNYRELHCTQSQEEAARLDVGGGLLSTASRRGECPVCGARETSAPLYRKAGLRLVRCLHCRLVFSETVLDALDDQAIYGANAFQAAYLRLKQNPSYAALEERKCRYIVEGLGRHAAPPGQLLEIGSGAGRLLDAARLAGWVTLGIEANAALAVDCRARGLDVVHGWFPGAMPPEAGEFRVVAMLDVLEHAVAPVELLRAVRRRLARGGVVVLQAPNFDSLIARLEGAASPVICHGHWNYFTCDTIAKCAAQAGLRTLHAETIISEIDRIAQFPTRQIEATLADIGAPAAIAGRLDADLIHEHRMGHKVLGYFAAA